MGSLYSISGLFFERVPRGIVPFGGSFMRENEDVESSIEGGLLDYYGNSDINGKISDSELEFRKRYENKGYEILYEFRFDKEKDCWLGEYSIGGFVGRAVCKIHEDFRGLQPAFHTLESVAKDIIDMMVEDDYLEIIKDPETGEDLIRPKE